MSVHLYNFSVDDFTITETRSRQKDTDYISASVAVAGRPTRSARQKLGDLNNGTFKTAMQFDGVAVADQETAVFTYLIVNSGHKDSEAAETWVEQRAKTLAEKGAKVAAIAADNAISAELGTAIGAELVPVIGSAMTALADWMVGSLGSLVFADCDGPVAAAVHTHSGARLRDATRHGVKLSESEHHTGAKCADGCGKTSSYDVRWSVRDHPVQIGKPIAEKWKKLGGIGGLLGSPLMDETACADKLGRFVHFERGAIYWTPQTGAVCVQGDILAKWMSMGCEPSQLGYPVEDEQYEGGGRGSEFQHGRILWQPGKGAWVA